MALRNLLALVIEDDAHQLLVMTTLLRELNIDYKRNTTGRDALAQAQSMQPRPDFFIITLDLREADPIRLCRAIRAKAEFHQTPVIAVGGAEWVTRQSQLYEAGFAAFIRLPLPRKLFGQVIEAVLNGNPPI